MNQRNCLILGSGRSGTSMAAGILARAGYFMGAELWPADIGNPKGYFEDREVNKINDELIAPAAPKTPPHGLRKLLLGDIPILGNYQHWIAVLRPGVSIQLSAGDELADRSGGGASALLPEGSQILVHSVCLAPVYRRRAVAMRFPRSRGHRLEHRARMQARGSHERHRGGSALGRSRCGRRCTALSWTYTIRRAATGCSSITTSCSTTVRTRNWSAGWESGSTANLPLPNSIARGRAPRCRAGRSGSMSGCARSPATTRPARRNHRIGLGGGPCSVCFFQHYQHAHAAEPSRKRPRDPVLGLHQRGQSVARQKAVRTESAA